MLNSVFSPPPPTPPTPRRQGAAAGRSQHRAGPGGWRCSGDTRGKKARCFFQGRRHKSTIHRHTISPQSRGKRVTSHVSRWHSWNKAKRPGRWEERPSDNQLLRAPPPLEGGVKKEEKKKVFNFSGSRAEEGGNPARLHCVINTKRPSNLRGKRQAASSWARPPHSPGGSTAGAAPEGAEKLPEGREGLRGARGRLAAAPPGVFPQPGAQVRSCRQESWEQCACSLRVPVCLLGCVWQVHCQWLCSFFFFFFFFFFCLKAFSGVHPKAPSEPC